MPRSLPDFILHIFESKRFVSSKSSSDNVFFSPGLDQSVFHKMSVYTKRNSLQIEYDKYQTINNPFF